MEEEKGTASSSARGTSSLTPSGPPPVASPSSSHAATEAAAEASTSQRQRFAVELRLGETTIVSWKRLVRESNKVNGEPSAPSGPPPVLESRMAQAAAAEPMENERKDAQPPPNRFSAVVEKIERLYMGKESSDEEELDDAPDDDQYDTEDSFIDDSELNEYFEVEKSATKHNGFFVNRGTLERIEPSTSAPNLAPKKRSRKYSTKITSVKDGEHTANELVNVGSVRMKAAARNAPLGKGSSSPENCQEGKILKNRLDRSVQMCRRKSTDPTVKLDSLPSMKMQNKDFLASSAEDKVCNQLFGATQSGDPANKLRPTEFFDDVNLSSREKGVSSQVKPQPRLVKENEVESFTKPCHMVKNGISDLPDLNSSVNMYPLQGAKSSWVKEASGIIRPKGTTLERAIRDLEKIVVSCRPPNMDIQECDGSSQLVKKRLPKEVKQKLAKVARLGASQGKVKEEDLLDRLMGILGHLVQRRTLKRNLKEMVELGLSAKQMKADMFHQIKKEVVEMIKMWIMNLKTKVPEQQDRFSDDFQEVTLKVKYCMDDAIEDKICDLYDLFVEGMDEDKGPQMRKLYVELAELWPNGYMDKAGIKRAICRAKERKKTLYRQQDRNERIRRKKMSPAVRMEDNFTLALQARALPNTPDSNGQVLTYADKATSNQPFPPSMRMSEHSTSLNCSAQHLGSKNPDKIRGSGISMDPGEGIKVDAATLKKKLKRKSETEPGETVVHLNSPSYCAKEKTNASKA
uniref:Ubinuclein-1 n=3 Tax=Anthurium amnicola TaxID=1678845 RepID=A0A1D1YC36_9ARAE